MDTFGSRLKIARKAAHLTQIQLAELSEVSQPAISDIERGRSEESVMAPRLAAALNVSVEWLLTGAGEMAGGSFADSVIQVFRDHGWEVKKEPVAKSVPLDKDRTIIWRPDLYLSKNDFCALVEVTADIDKNALNTGKDAMFITPLNLASVLRELNAQAEPERLQELQAMGRAFLVPVISFVKAGSFDTAMDPYVPGYADDWVPCPKKTNEHTYALRVRGDSMTAPYGKTYPEGCIIFVDPLKKSPVNGDRVIAKLNGSDEVTFKQFQNDAGRIWLRPLNPQYPPIFDEFSVLGTVIGKWEDD